MKKKRVIFRIFPFNRLTIPLLLNLWEKAEIDNHLNIIISEDIPEPEPGDIIIYSFMTPHLQIIHRELETLKHLKPVFAGGGPHITGDIELSEKLGFNILIPGESEKSFVDFGKDIINGKISESSFKIYFPEGHSDISNNIPVSRYMRLIPPLEITRGCFWKCKYCETGNIPLRTRSFDSIIEYLENLKFRNFKRVGFISPSSLEFGSEKPGRTDTFKIERVFKAVKERNFEYMEYGVFPSEIRPETFNDEFAKLLKKYVSNRSLTFGAQSGSPERLKELRRGNRPEDILKAIETANEYGFIANIDFILGFPDETSEERKITFDFIRNIVKKFKVRIQFHRFFPLSGSYYNFRFPSHLTEDEKNYLEKLKQDGIATTGWKYKEKPVDDYFSWLKSKFPFYLKKFK